MAEVPSLDLDFPSDVARTFFISSHTSLILWSSSMTSSTLGPRVENVIFSKQIFKVSRFSFPHLARFYLWQFSPRWTKASFITQVLLGQLSNTTEFSTSQLPKELSCHSFEVWDQRAKWWFFTERGKKVNKLTHRKSPSSGGFHLYRKNQYFCNSTWSPIKTMNTISIVLYLKGSTGFIITHVIPEMAHKQLQSKYNMCAAHRSQRCLEPPGKAILARPTRV